MKLESLEALKWQPIASAPVDGTFILVYDETNNPPVVVASWANDSIGRSRKCYCWCLPGSWQDEQGGYYTVDPTHWMPLPEKPGEP